MWGLNGLDRHYSGGGAFKAFKAHFLISDENVFYGSRTKDDLFSDSLAFIKISVVSKCREQLASAEKKSASL